MYFISFSLFLNSRDKKVKCGVLSVKVLMVAYALFIEDLEDEVCNFIEYSLEPETNKVAATSSCVCMTTDSISFT